MHTVRVPTATVKVMQVKSVDGQHLNLRSDCGIVTASTNAAFSVVALVRYQDSQYEYTLVSCATEEDYQKFLERGYEEILRVEPTSEAGE